MKKILLFILLFGISWGCTSVMDEKFISSGDYILFVAKNKEKMGLSESEMKTLGKYILQASMQDKEAELVGKSYKEILSIATKEQEEKAAAKAKAEAEAKAKAEAMEATIRITLTEKGYVPSNINQLRMESYITFSFLVENLSEKDINAFNGVIEFQDLLGEEILSLKYTFDEGIKAGTNLTEERSIEYNKYESTHKNFYSKKVNQIKTIFKGNKILFADGTTLE